MNERAEPESDETPAGGYPIGCDGWLTIKEAARLMGVSDRTVERRIKARSIRAYGTAAEPDARGGVRVCRRSVDIFIAGRER